MGAPTFDTLDLFIPEVLVSAVLYQHTTDEQLWEQRHINGMNTICDYLQAVHPAEYRKVAAIHQHFQTKEPDI